MTNELLGLPHSDDGKMQKVVWAFDVDGTLIDTLGNEREQYTRLLIDMYRAFKNTKIVIWSGGGKQYAETIGARLGLDSFVWRYMSKLEFNELRDTGWTIVAFDDIQDTRLGDVNAIVRQ